MADSQFRLILEAADAEELRSEGNASEDDTDLECEEEEVASQSDSLTGQAASRPGQAASVSGRKRMYSETTLEQFSPTSSDTKCRQASDLHNERERERRKDLKQAVHRLRNQLQLRKTKKATTISVLKASEQEIKDLLSMEAKQNRELDELQNRHKHLTWKLESLIAEQHKEGPRTVASSDSAPMPAPLLPTAPPLTSVAPVSYMPPTASAIHSPSFPTASLTPFPFAPSLSPFDRFQHPSSLLPSPPSFPMPAHLHGFSPRPFLLQSLPLPPILSPGVVAQGHLAGRFTFPTATGSLPPSHLLPPALMLHSIPPPGPLTATPYSFFQHNFLAPSAETSATSSNSSWISTALQTPPSGPLHYRSEQEGNSPFLHSVQILPNPRSNESHYPSSSQMEQDSGSGSQLSGENSGSEQAEDGGSEQLIDVESTDQEEESSDQSCNRRPFLDLRTCQHRQQRRPRKHMNFTKEKTKNWQSPPALVKQARVIENNTVSQIINHMEPATKATTKDMFASALQRHSLYFDNTNTARRDRDTAHAQGLRSWKNVTHRTKKIKQTSPSIVDLNPMHCPPPVICS